MERPGRSRSKRISALATSFRFVAPLLVPSIPCSTCLCTLERVLCLFGLSRAPAAALLPLLLPALLFSLFFHRFSFAPASRPLGSALSSSYHANGRVRVSRPFWRGYAPSLPLFSLYFLPRLFFLAFRRTQRPFHPLQQVTWVLFPLIVLEYFFLVFPLMQYTLRVIFSSVLSLFFAFLIALACSLPSFP